MLVYVCVRWAAPNSMLLCAINMQIFGAPANIHHSCGAFIQALRLLRSYAIFRTLVVHVCVSVYLFMCMCVNFLLQSRFFCASHHFIAGNSMCNKISYNSPAVMNFEVAPQYFLSAFIVAIW